MNVLIFGLGVNGGGYAAARYYIRKGDTVRVCDAKDNTLLRCQALELGKLGATCILGSQDDVPVLWADLVVKNPGVSPSLPLLSGAKRITSDITELFLFLSSKPVKILAVTGTKGKTTAATATAYALNKLGHTAELCGNMGISGYTLLSSWEEGKHLPEYVVMELSSFQIRDAYEALGHHFPPIEAVLLTSFFPDHQNTYHSMEAYLGDKLKLFGPWVSHTMVPKSLVCRVPAASCWESIPFLPRPELQASHALCAELGLDANNTLASFPGVPHRRELVLEWNGIRFINDSTATIAEAVQYTCSLLGGSINLITGGTEKELPVEAMASDLLHASSVTLLDGSFTRNKIIPLLEHSGKRYFGPYKTMDEAVHSATEQALSAGGQQVVLLSPGSSSFELFANEFDRGDQFRRCVVSCTGGSQAK